MGVRISVTIGIGSPLLLRAALAGLLVLSARAAIAQSITGTAAYRERMALPPAISFTIAYDPAKIVANHRYVVRARILVDDQPLFITENAPAVITSGKPNSVSIVLRRVSAEQTAQPAASGAKSLEGTYWTATELAGKPLSKQDAKRGAHVVFQPGGRFSGSDGCNQISGTYQMKGDAVTFGKMIATQMACLDTGGAEQEFRDAIQSAARFAVVGDRLELADAVGRRVVVFAAAPTTPAPTPSPGLAGTTWQLVKFQGGDGTTLTPDDRAKYTMEFAADGSLIARIDCNRGRGTWKSSDPNQLQFGPLALTRAQCPAGSLHDRLVKQWGFIRSYVIEDGHLFLSLMADGGIYEFEAVTKTKPQI